MLDRIRDFFDDMTANLSKRQRNRIKKILLWAVVAIVAIVLVIVVVKMFSRGNAAPVAAPQAVATPMIALPAADPTPDPLITSPVVDTDPVAAATPAIDDPLAVDPFAEDPLAEPEADPLADPEAAATPVPAEGAAADGDALAKLGDESDLVKQIQTKLKKLGAYKGKINGKYGKQTQDAVSAFQKKYKLTVTGICDQETVDALKAAKKK